MANESTKLVAHVTRFRDEVWDPAVLRRTELCLLDSLSCFSAGRRLDQFAPSINATLRLFLPLVDPAAQAPIPSFALAYLYGQAANALDYDDTLVGHPGAAIVGAVLSTGLRERLSADRLLRGIAAGYEAHGVLGAASLPSPNRGAQVRSNGSWDTVSASLGIGVALGLDDATLHRVIGVAAAHSVLPYTAKWYERPVPALKNNLGWVSAGAVLATYLTIEGQAGVTNVLDGDTGMWRMVGSDQWQFDKVLQRKPAVLRTGFKQFPACWFMQEYLKVFSTLLTSLSPNDEVIEIVLAGPHAVEKFCQRRIHGPADLAFSFPATFSLLLSSIEPGPEWDSPENRSAALRHTNVFRYVESDAKFISILTRNGARLEAVVETCDPVDLSSGGLDERGVLAKFRRLTEPALYNAAATVLQSSNPVLAEAIPELFYDVINSMMTDLTVDKASPN